MDEGKMRYKRTLFVGLGGAGAKTLRILKQRIIEKNGGQPNQIKFLLIDTNSTELSNFRDFDNSEKICIAVREPYQRYLHDKDTSTHEFIPKQNAHSLLALERGAGQIRSNGHFAVIENQYSNKLMRIFRERADELENIDIKESTLEKDPKIEIRLVFSIAGGTGSGTFLPIATILRAAVKHCELTAYIYSATNFSKKVENSAKYSVMQNAYAALCELDYMMHFGRDEKRHKNITFNFGPSENQHMEQSNRPFDEVYYIDKHTNLPDADSVEFSYNEIDRLQENTAEAMYLAATNIITAHTGTVDNVRQKIMEGQFDVSDKFAWVSGLGLAELYFEKLGFDNSSVINACLKAINERTDETQTWENKTIETIVKKFTYNTYDESRGDADGNPVLRRFVEEDQIKKYCSTIVKNLENTATSDEMCDSKNENAPSLSKCVSKNKETETVDKIKQECIDGFKKDVNKLIESLIDKKKYRDNELGEDKYVEGFGKESGGLSLEMVKKIIDALRNKLVSSQNTLTQERDGIQEKDGKTNGGLKGKEEKANEDIRRLRRKIIEKPQTGFKIWKPSTWWSNPNPPQNVTNANADNEIHPKQKDALENHILIERHTAAIAVFEECIKFIDNDVKKEIDDWVDILNGGKRAGNDEIKKERKSTEKTKRKGYSVEVQNVKIGEGFHFKYENLEKLRNDKKGNNLGTDEFIFHAIKEIFLNANGSLHEYLKNGIEEIEAQTQSGEVKIERTECQQKIDRLIDLSSPTMQVDRHGYGERVKVDHFWYVMTDCPEANVADKSKDGADKSVGGLLKDLIEQNTLEAKVNLVHVPGWENKAIVYRVDSAVPVYFVDGVCESTEGGYTLEGCYEELKKTKLTYTPFSHETLRKLLENRKCALKPMDSVEDSKVLDYWLNFIMFRKIVIRGEGDEAYYCIDSERCGERISNQLECRNRVLLLGKTRTEAYNTFQRYCGELIKEWKTYEEDIKKPFFPETAQEDKKKNVYQIFSCDYINDKQLCQYSGDISRLTKDDDDFIILDREMTRIDKRALEYADKVRKTSMNERLSNCDRKDISEYCNKLKTLSNQD